MCGHETHEHQRQTPNCTRQSNKEDQCCKAISAHEHRVDRLWKAKEKPRTNTELNESRNDKPEQSVPCCPSAEGRVPASLEKTENGHQEARDRNRSSEEKKKTRNHRRGGGGQ